MKAFLVNIGIIISLIGAYYIDLFGLFASPNALLYSIILVIIVLIAALKVLGNPFKKEDDDENK